MRACGTGGLTDGRHGGGCKREGKVTHRLVAALGVHAQLHADLDGLVESSLIPLGVLLHELERLEQWQDGPGQKSRERERGRLPVSAESCRAAIAAAGEGGPDMQWFYHALLQT